MCGGHDLPHSSVHSPRSPQEGCLDVLATNFNCTRVDVYAPCTTPETYPFRRATTHVESLCQNGTSAPASPSPPPPYPPGALQGVVHVVEQVLLVDGDVADWTANRTATYNSRTKAHGPEHSH